MQPITLLCPAKVNLTLEITGTRADGYHLLRSIMQPVDLFDELKIDAEQGSGISLSATGIIKMPSGSDNLIYKAAELYLKTTGINANIDIHLNKNISMQAGLGGGSSNAAATLFGLNRIFGEALGTEKLIELAARVGADVPFFIQCRTALVEGIGEKITLLGDFPLLNYLIVKPPYGLETESVYSKWDESGGLCSEPLNITDTIESYKNGDYILKNDLEKPALALENRISGLKEMLRGFGCTHVAMSGSGTAVFAIFDTQNEAKDVYDYLKYSPELKVYLCKGISGWHRLT